MYQVRVERTEDGVRATNGRGAEIALSGSADEGVFTPVELMLAALGGCEIVTVEPLTAKRGHRLVRLAATVEADKAETSRLGPITVTFDVELPAGDGKAAEVFEAVAKRVHERYCTVGNTIKNAHPVEQVLPKL